ncbi:uncharacterized protein LOC135076281 isoform X2 [Ostrinia nubilalis]|uniref:uncharacterized protein LOC135076281 isoform X2 n=1 Tax=Ostrinia nubilalis TaxID=29057 RepID=UPI0030825706
MYRAKVIMVALFLCFYSTSAIPPPYRGVDNYPNIEVRLIIHKFVINTTDVIYEDEISTEILGDKFAIQNVTASGFKNCTGENVTRGKALKFKLNCPRIVAEYESESCKHNVNNTVEKCEFVYENETVHVTADVIEGYQEPDFGALHVRAENLTFISTDGGPPPSNRASLKKQLQYPILAAFLKKADLLVHEFF